MNYSKWDTLAREEEQAEKSEKQRVAQQNKEKYMKEQEERKAKFLEEQKAKKKEAKRLQREQEQLAQQQQQSQNHETCNDPNHDHSHSHSHGHGSGSEHDHQHSHDHSHDGHAHGGPSQDKHTTQDDDSDSDIDESQFRRGCSCGYADPEELKKRAAAAAKEPQLTLEEKNIKKVRAVEATREHGNQLFKEGNYMHAYQVYERGVLICNGIYGLDSTAADAMTQLECTLNLNMAACKLKLKEWQQAIDTCKLALQLERTSVKAYYRMGEAYMGMGEYDLAEEKLNQALKLEPHNKTTQDKIKEVGTLRIKQEEKQKQTEEQMRQNMKTQILKMKQQQQPQKQTIQPTQQQPQPPSQSQAQSV